MPLNLPQLPPDLKDRLAPLMERAGVLWQDVLVLLGPLGEEASRLVRSTMQRMEESAPGATFGAHFRHLAIVGLNRVELLMSGETESISGDSWQDLVDETLRRHTALVFFAPRGLDGQPVNPYLFLAGEGALSDSDEESSPDANVLSAAQQAAGGLALFDFCRMSPAAPNTVNMLLAADSLFHWDVKDNYVLPTSTTGWVRDVEHVMKSYPRTTRYHIYTQWEVDVFPPSDRVIFHKLRELPLDDGTWLNQPTFQEKYGPHVLMVSLILAAAVYGLIFMKGRTQAELQDRLSEVEQQIPRGGQFSDLEKAITEQEKQFKTRELFPLLVKDAARSAQRANFQIVNFEVKVDDVQNPPKQYVLTWEAKPGIYQGWLQEEPVARELMLNSAVLQAIRKPPLANTFKLEGLVHAETLRQAYVQQIKRFVKQAPVKVEEPKPLPPSPTGPVLPKQAFVATAVPHVLPAAGAPMPEGSVAAQGEGEPMAPAFPALGAAASTGMDQAEERP